MSNCVSRLGRLTLAVALAAGAPLALAQSKTARMVVAFPPGGGTDITARQVAPRMSELLGMNIVVDNRPGASTNIAHEQVARAAPDGLTMLMGTPTLTINPGLFSKLNYDTLKDFTAVSLVSSTPNVLVVPTALPAKDFKAFLALVRARPGDMNYSSAGSGTPQHLASELFRTNAKVNIQHVPYKGTTPALTALIGGEVGMTFSNIVSAIGYIKSGRLRALGTTGATRAALLPDVPTMKEHGIDMETSVWYGILVPSATPPDIVKRLADATIAAVKTPDLRQRMIDSGADPVGSTPEEFAALIKREVPQYAAVIRAAGAKAD